MLPRPARAGRRPGRRPPSRGECVGQHQRQQRRAGPGAHGRQVAQIDGERAVSDGVRRHEPAVEVDAVDQRVGREDVEVPRSGLTTAASSPGPTTTHEGMASREVMRSMSARSPMGTEWMSARWRRAPASDTAWGEGRADAEEYAPLCRVGRSSEPAKAGGAAVIGRASGFLGTEACTTRGLAARLVVTLAQTSLRKTITSKAGAPAILACGRGWVKAR